MTRQDYGKNLTVNRHNPLMQGCCFSVPTVEIPRQEFIDPVNGMPFGNTGKDIT
jgi:hypothetical protein